MNPVLLIILVTTVRVNVGAKCHKGKTDHMVSLSLTNRLRSVTFSLLLRVFSLAIRSHRLVFIYKKNMQYDC